MNFEAGMEKGKAVIVVTGPTATGKTALGVELCLHCGGEVISADSMQVYRGMDIGTAKVTLEETRGVPHHMIDVAEPDEHFSAARWADMAARCAEDIFSRGRVPVIVGGTGLYIDSLLSGRDFAASEGDGQLRCELSAEYDAIGGGAFREKLRAVDPQRAETLHPSDKKRLVRALEVYTLTGKTISQHDKETKALPPRWPSVRFALSFADRQRLYDRIDVRVDEMIERGLFNEVRSLLNGKKISQNATSMQAIGYKEAVEYINGGISAGDAAELIKRASRRYAKRQLTWLRRNTGLNWIQWRDRPDITQGVRIAEAALRESGFFNF